MILWEDGPHLYPPDLTVLHPELSLKEWIQTQQLVLNTDRAYCKRLGLCRNVLGTICFDFIRITLSKDALRTLCDRVRSVFGLDERVRNGQGRYEIVLLTVIRSHLVFGTMALRLISGRDSFSNILSRFKILRGHLDQTRPYSSNNVRKQFSIGCYYDQVLRFHAVQARSVRTFGTYWGRVLV